MIDRNLVDLFQRQAEKYSHRTALKHKIDGRYRDISWSHFRHQVICVALALRKAGLKRGDRAAILSENRPEWPYADLGTMAAGGVVVPIHATASLKEMQYVLEHCKAKVIFVSNQAQLARVVTIEKQLGFLRHVIVFDTVQNVGESVRVFSEFISSAGCKEADAATQIKTLVNNTRIDDAATIIYTSGTTGPSKGVVLTHRNFLTNCHDTKQALPFSDQDITLSFLPLSHVFERMGGYYLSILCGGTIAYAEDMTTVAENLREVKPTVACAVPRFFEKMCEGINRQAEQGSKVKQAIFKWAVQVGQKWAQATWEHRKPSLSIVLQHRLAHALVYSKIYEKMGGRLRFFVSGGAPLPISIAEFFYSIGILLLEGYGLTETSPVLAVNQYDKFRFGSVGLPLASVQIKITEDKEIIARGDSVMTGYFENQKATSEAIQGGWFHTGDLGRFDEGGYLYIIGRKKDIIVTSAGKNVAPQNIENSILADPYVEQVVLIGDRRNFVTALIVPNFIRVKKTLGLAEETSAEQLIQVEEVHALIRERLNERTRGCASYEKIKYFTLLPRELSIEKEEMTLTMKIKRPVVEKHFQEAIDKMYAGAEERYQEGREELFYVV